MTFTVHVPEKCYRAEIASLCSSDSKTFFCVFVYAQKPIVEYLKDNHYFDDQDKLLDLIPQTILLQHYVSFRLALRRLATSVVLLTA